MTTYLIRRFLLLFPTLFGITLLTFVLLRLSPINPAHGQTSGAHGAHPMTAEQRDQLVKFYELDKPWYVAYYHWLKKVALHGDLSDSFVDHRPVIAKIGERIGLTASIAGTSLILSYLIGIPLGVIAAIKRGQIIDRTISFVVFVLYSIPNFVAALVLILYVAGGDYLNLLPMYGIHSFQYYASPMGWFPSLWDRILHMILPVICLTYASFSYISRYARVSMLEALGQDFIRTARAKGLSERLVIMRHAFRNALIPILTIFTLELPGLIGGAIIIESIFSLPGMGQLMITSLDAGDYMVIMGVTLLAAVVTLLSYLAADILYAVADPRITYQ